MSTAPGLRRTRTAGLGTVKAVLRRVFAVVVIAVALTACSTHNGPNDNPHPGAATASEVDGVQQITVEATSDFRFRPSTITVHPGKVRVILKNVGNGAPHNWSLTGFPADFVPLTAAGQTAEAEFTAPSPGTYQFVCTIHLRQGQTGKLIVKP